MEINFAPQDSDEHKKIPVNWQSDELKSLWISLLNLEKVSKEYEDVELQGIFLLLETTFNVFKNLKHRYAETENSYNLMKQDLKTAKEDVCKLKEQLECCKELSCKRCPVLENDLSLYKKRLENNENRIKSIVNILSVGSGSQESESDQESTHHTVMTKAYNLVSQMLLGDELKQGTKREHHDSTSSVPVRTPRKKKLKLSRGVLGLQRAKCEAETQGGTLVPETLTLVEKPINLPECDRNIPETPCTQYAVNENNVEENVLCPPDGASSHVNNIETTPKKQSSLVKTAESDSPILGGSSKKSGHKITHSHCSPQNDSPEEDTLTSQTCQAPVILLDSDNDELKSPSLLKTQSAHSTSLTNNATKAHRSKGKAENGKQDLKAFGSLQDSEGKNLKIQADFWKLKPSSTEFGNRKLKQTTLNLACYPKKQDLSTLKEFNGGVRQSVGESDSLIDKINGDCDEETSFQIALQQSLNDKENVGVLKREERNLGLESAEDDDFVVSSPNAGRRKVNVRLKNALNMKNGSVPGNTNLKKDQIQSVTETRDADETMFVPLFTSTMKDESSSRQVRLIPETVEEPFSVQLLDKLACPAGETQPITVTKHETSFDRIPVKISTSPNYKYKRDAVRGKEARRKLDGWDCEQCRNYYALASHDLDPAELKHRLNLCSKHRDKYPVQSNTPPGYWDFKFPDTEKSRIEEKTKRKL